MIGAIIVDNAKNHHLWWDQMFALRSEFQPIDSRPHIGVSINIPGDHHIGIAKIFSNHYLTDRPGILRLHALVLLYFALVLVTHASQFEFNSIQTIVYMFFAILSTALFSLVVAAFDVILDIVLVLFHHNKSEMSDEEFAITLQLDRTFQGSRVSNILFWDAVLILTVGIYGHKYDDKIYSQSLYCALLRIFCVHALFLQSTIVPVLGWLLHGEQNCAIQACLAHLFFYKVIPLTFAFFSDEPPLWTRCFQNICMETSVLLFIGSCWLEFQSGWWFPLVIVYSQVTGLLGVGNVRCRFL